jgi:hypothetical protein
MKWEKYSEHKGLGECWRHLCMKLDLVIAGGTSSQLLRAFNGTGSPPYEGFREMRLVFV